MRGRGTDLSGSDRPDKPLSCATTDCHTVEPHKAPVLNNHTQRINCTVCHIPTFARDEPTDMLRDWSKPVYNAEADKYTANITLQKDVKPVYAWFNGFTKAQLTGEPVSRLSDGSVGIMVPQGSKKDSKAQLFAFKLHRGKLPLLTEKNWLIPITVEHFFANGQIDPAVKLAAKETYGIADAQYTWTDTSRYMGIFHGVQPASKALQCLECHSPQGRMDWKALGYKKDPLEAVLKHTRKHH